MKSDSSSARKLPEGLSEELEYLTPEHADEAAWLLVDAFLNDDENDPEGLSPVYAFITEGLLLPPTTNEGNGTSEKSNRELQRQALHWIFGKNLRAHLEHDASNGQQTPCRCAFLRKPNQPPKMVCFMICSSHTMGNPGMVFKLSPWVVLRYAIFLFPVWFGWKAFSRLISMSDQYEAITDDYLATHLKNLDPYRKIERMVVHPSLQGKGVGTHFLKQATENSGGSEGGCCVLSTQEERNVAFYKKLGFKVVREDNLATGDETPGIASWLMVRPGKASLGQSNAS